MKVGNQAAAHGITMLCDMAAGAFGDAAEIEGFEKMFAAGCMKTRIRVYLFDGKAEEWDKVVAKPGYGNALMRVSGWKMVVDGSNQLSDLHLIRVGVVRDLWKEPGTILAPKERVGVEAAIRSITRDAAWLSHSKNEIGSVEPGKFADLVVLDSDPRKVEPRKISDIKIHQTRMDGRQVYGS